MIYLDFNRTTPLAPSALEAMQPFWSTHFMLPGQEHPHARGVSEAIENAREGLANMAGCEPFELVFTGGGTEANNLAVLGSIGGTTAAGEKTSGNGDNAPGHVLVSALEHESVLNAAKSLTCQGWEVETVAPGADGVIDVDDFASRFRSNTRLACLQLANPVLGTIQPVGELAARCRRHDIRVHCDATQGFGKISVNVAQLGVDTAAISGHKIYGPKGSGAVYVRRGLTLEPIAFGESGEMGLRPGCENVPNWIGLGAAASLAWKCADDVAEELTKLRRRFVERLKAVVSPEPVVLCGDSERLPNTVAIEMPLDARRIQRCARQLVIATARSGDPPDEFTRALRAIGRSDAQIGRTLRISLGWTSSQEQVDQAADMLAEAADAG